jgi:hypothetical protein
VAHLLGSAHRLLREPRFISHLGKRRQLLDDLLEPFVVSCVFLGFEKEAFDFRPIVTSCGCLRTILDICSFPNPAGDKGIFSNCTEGCRRQIWSDTVTGASF